MHPNPHLPQLRPRHDFSAVVIGAVVFVTLALLPVSPSPAAAETRIIIAGPMSGPYAGRTRDIEQGARRAVETLNASAGTDFAIETIDDGCDDAKAAGVARALVAKRAALVLGHPCASAAIAAAGIYGKSETVFIATATRHPGLTDKRAGQTIFRLSGRDARQGATAARYLIETFAGKEIAVVHDRTLYAKTIAEQAVETLKAVKLEPITATVVGGDKEYKRLIAKIKRAGVVFYAGFPLEAGFILQALRSAGSDARFIVSDSVATLEFTQSFSTPAKGVLALLPHAPTSISSGTQSLSAGEALAHAAVEIYASAKTRAAASEPVKAVTNSLNSGWHSTSIGLTGFNEAGDANVPDYEVLEWDGAAWVRPNAAGVSTSPR